MNLFLTVVLCAVFLLRPADCAAGVHDGLSLAAHTALPALFPFFLSGALLVRSGTADVLSRLAARPLTRLYRLPGEAAAAVLLGWTGGYPVGAATTAELVRQGRLSPEDGARVNTFCNCASPGFCIGLVGLHVCGSARTGALLYGIHLLAAALTGLIIARQDSAAARPPASAVHAPHERFAAAFCAAVQQAAATALTVTAFLTAFSILLQLLNPLFGLLPGGSIAPGLIELTRGLMLMPSLPLSARARLTLCSFLLGFGGLAVHFQIRAIAAPCGLPVTGLTAAKLLHGAIAAALTAGICRLSPTALTVFAPNCPPAAVPPVLPAVFAGATILFVIYTGKRAENTV